MRDVRFRRALRGMQGVKRLQVSEMKSNRAILEVDYAGSPQQLADALMRQTFDSFGVMIHEVLPEGLAIGLHTGQPSAAEAAPSPAEAAPTGQPPAQSGQSDENRKIED